MQYDFDQIISRKGTNSVKWEYEFKDEQPIYRPMQDNPLADNQILPLWVADMDFRSPQPIVDALVTRAQHGIFGYTKPGDSFYNAIMSWMQNRHDWTIERDSISVMPGVVPSINLIIDAFTKPGDGIIIQTPVYHPFYSSVELNERVLKYNPMIEQNGRYDIDFADLEANAADPNTTMAILCSPHNPVGRVWSAEELRRFAMICTENDVLIISDEIHHDLIYSWGNFTTIGVACPEAMDNIIVCAAPSKTFNIPGLKTSIAIATNADLHARIEAALARAGIFGPSALGSTGLEAAYAHGEEWLTQAMAYIEANYHFLESYFADNLPQVRVFCPDATYLVWTDWRQFGLDAEALNSRIYDEAGVFLNDGSGFGAAGAGFMRINIACPRRVLETALDRICRVMQPL
jgi:cystathionine beta-lyase